MEKKEYLARPELIGNVVEDYYEGATRIIICDDSCCSKETAHEIIDEISRFAVNNLTLFTK